MSGELWQGGAGSYEDDSALENDYEAPTNEDDTAWDSVVDYGQQGALGSDVQLATTLYEAGETVPEDSRDDAREAVENDEDSGWWAEAAVDASTYSADGADGAEDAVGDVTDAAGDAVDGVTDPSTYLDPFPDWAPYAAAGVGLLVVLMVLAPYAELGAEVSGS